jgi:hypothetical protein
MAVVVKEFLFGYKRKEERNNTMNPGVESNNDLRFRNYQKAVINNGDAESGSAGSKIWNCVFSKYGAALIAAFLVFIVLIAVRPSFVMEEPSSAFEEGKLSWWRVIVWSVIAGLIVLLIPSCKKYFSSSDSAADPGRSGMVGAPAPPPSPVKMSSFNPGAYQRYESF